MGRTMSALALRRTGGKRDCGIYARNSATAEQRCWPAAFVIEDTAEQQAELGTRLIWKR
jgi:hypothetical protein